MSTTTEKKTYVADFKSFGQYGSIKGRIYLHRIKDHLQTDEKGREYLPVVINANKGGVDKYGNTHSAVIDTWKPDTAKSKDGLPF